MKGIFSLLIVSLAYCLSGQQAPNFSFTDVNGNSHNLYTDYLDKGVIVVSKIYFADCPPCNASAPSFQAKYVQQGSGNNGVEFIALSNKSWDNNSKVNEFKNRHGITFPIAGNDGGSVAAQATYTGGLFGPFYGQPHYTVFAPDKTVHYDINQNEIDMIVQQIKDGMNNAPGVPVTIQTTSGKPIPSGVEIMMKPANSNSPILNLTQITNGSYTFTYPSAEVPEIQDPVIYINSTNVAQDGSLRVGDLIPIRKHILGLEPFTTEQELIVSDVNGDGNIRSSDLVVLRRVILGLDGEFPGIPSYVLYGGEVALDTSNQTSITLDLDILKIGNLVD